MSSMRLMAIMLLVGASLATCAAQKPYKNSGKISYSKTTGKGTPANLSHHSDKSALILHQNARSGAAADLNKIEQQSLHAATGTSGPKPVHVRAAPLPKLGSPAGGHNPQINFNGRSAPRGLSVTNQKSGGRQSGPAKPH